MSLEIFSTQDETVIALLRLARYYSCVINMHLWPLKLCISNLVLNFKKSNVPCVTLKNPSVDTCIASTAVDVLMRE